MGDATAPPSAARDVDVVIIGAGLSGLQAATNIQAAGLTFVVLEAKDRVGGKTCSVPTGIRSGVVDVGAAWINDTTQRRMYALSQKFGIDVIQQRATGRDILQREDGSVELSPYGDLGLTKEEKVQLDVFIAHIDAMGEKLDPEDPSAFANAKELDNITLDAYCRKHLPGEVAPRMASGTARGFLGVESTEISALFYIHYVRSGHRLESLTSDLKGGAQYLRARQGWQTISQKFVAGLADQTVLLNTPVSSITQSGSGCVVESRNTRTSFTCKRVIVSVPNPLLKHIEFTPSLPAGKLAVAASTHLGFTAKTILLYNSPWWRDLDLSGVLQSSIGPLAFTRDSSSDIDGQFSLTCFLVGDSGRAWAKIPTAAERKTNFIEHVKTLFAPILKEQKELQMPVKVIEQIWTEEEWIWGCPCPVTDLGTLAKGPGKIRRQAFKRLHFIGTETSVEYQGYMEGAVASGERGSKEVIELCNEYLASKHVLVTQG